MYQIAIVDDVEDSREFLYYLLCDHYVVRRYESGAQALLMIPQDPPHVLILDISLRDMDGREVLKKIRADSSLSRMSVIALTAHAMTGDREKYLAAGFDEYVSKPVMDIDVLLKAIDRNLPR